MKVLNNANQKKQNALKREQRNKEKAKANADREIFIVIYGRTINQRGRAQRQV